MFPSHDRGGDYSKLAGGYYSKLAGGDNSKLAGGDYSQLAGGDNSMLAGGKNCLMIGDMGSQAKGEMYSVITLVERDKDYNISNFKAFQIDGKKYKENTYYKLENGKITEVK